MMLIPMGQARARSGDVEGARADLERGVRIAERIGEHDDEAKGYLALGELARQEDRDLDQARQLLERALEITEPHLRRPGMSTVAMSAYSKLGCLHEQQGDLAGAAGWHAKAIGAGRRQRRRSSCPTIRPWPRWSRGSPRWPPPAASPAGRPSCSGLAHTLHGFRNAASLEVSPHRRGGDRTALGAGAFEAAYAPRPAA